MPLINTSVLVLTAADIGLRANDVRRDPAVVKAAKEARADIAQAIRSTHALLQETNAAWRRSASSYHDHGASLRPV